MKLNPRLDGALQQNAHVLPSMGKAANGQVLIDGLPAVKKLADSTWFDRACDRRAQKRGRIGGAGTDAARNPLAGYRRTLLSGSGPCKYFFQLPAAPTSPFGAVVLPECSLARVGRLRR
jgi:hypothetical protein